MQPDLHDFEAARSLAIVGVSRGGAGFGNAALKTLRERGYEVYPVNANVDEVGGEKCYRSLADLPVPVDVVVSVVPPAVTPQVVEECARLGLKRLWMQQGSESKEAIALAEQRGLSVVPGACVLMHYKPSGFHAFHAWWARTFSGSSRARTASRSS